MTLQSSIVFVSLGMVVLDEIRIPHRARLLDVVGGSGAFATLGFRLFSPGAQSKTTGCLVIAGNDFPDAVKKRLRSWDTTLVVKQDVSRASTRGLIEYAEDAQSSTYTHTTYPLPPIPQDLVNKPLLASTTFHFLCHPTELLLHVSQLLALRAAHGITSRPFIVWEPTPASCTPANRPQVLKAVREVDVFSPNHTEIANLFAPTPESEFDRKTVLACALHFVNAASLTGTQATVVVRCGEHGCLTLPPSPGWMWMPAFYAPGAKEVVDASGAGSAFLGGYVAGWLESRDAWEASVWGSVAASFSVEQIGCPVVSGGEGGAETWNGVSVVERFGEFRKRVERKVVGRVEEKNGVPASVEYQGEGMWNGVGVEEKLA